MCSYVTRKVIHTHIALLTAFLFSSADTALCDRCLKRSITLETGPLLVLLPVELSEPARGLVVTVVSGVPLAVPVSELEVDPLLLAVLRFPDDGDINEFCNTNDAHFQ